MKFKIDERKKEILEEIEKINATRERNLEDVAAECEKEGYPAHGSNYELRAEIVDRYFDEQIVDLRLFDSPIERMYDENGEYDYSFASNDYWETFYRKNYDTAITEKERIAIENAYQEDIQTYSPVELAEFVDIEQERDVKLKEIERTCKEEGFSDYVINYEQTIANVFFNQKYDNVVAGHYGIKNYTDILASEKEAKRQCIMNGYDPEQYKGCIHFAVDKGLDWEDISRLLELAELGKNDPSKAELVQKERSLIYEQYGYELSETVAPSYAEEYMNNLDIDFEKDYKEEIPYEEYRKNYFDRENLTKTEAFCEKYNLHVEVYGRIVAPYIERDYTEKELLDICDVAQIQINEMVELSDYCEKEGYFVPGDFYCKSAMSIHHEYEEKIRDIEEEHRVNKDLLEEQNSYDFDPADEE